MNKVMSLKLYELFDEILEKHVLEYKDLMNNLSDKEIPKESIIFLDSAYSSIMNSVNLLNENNFVDSLCLLRSVFEAIMFSLAIYFDEETYEVYKNFNSDNYRKYLELKYKKIKQKNPKFRPPVDTNKRTDYLKPQRIRSIVVKNYELVFGDFSNEIENIETELNDFYQYLCNFTHPSISKTYFYKMQNDEECLNNIKTIFKLNIYYCKMLLLLSMNFFTTKNDKETFLEFYGILFLLSLSQIDDIKNFKNVLKKYEEYLYIDLTRMYFNSKKDKLRKLEKEFKEIISEEGTGEILTRVFLGVIKKLKSEDLVNKYFNVSI